MKNETTQTLSALVDRLGVLAAAAAEIDTEVKALKAELILSGVETLEEDLYRVAVSHCPGRETTDWKALALALGATDDLVAAYTTQGTPFTTVRVSARKGA